MICTAHNPAQQVMSKSSMGAAMVNSSVIEAQVIRKDQLTCCSQRLENLKHNSETYHSYKDNVTLPLTRTEWNSDMLHRCIKWTRSPPSSSSSYLFAGKSFSVLKNKGEEYARNLQRVSIFSLDKSWLSGSKVFNLYLFCIE